MKKISILLATAALLAACSEREGVLQVSYTDSDAINFSAYTGETTKGVVEVNTEITKEDGTGIGVFAFYQPAVDGVKVDFNTRKFATPDFMYNQKVYNHVWTSGAAATWGYAPIKYWPNNEGDQLSFFAYAPYEEGTTWDDLGIATDATASKITASFPIYNEKAAMQDILWTDPQLNKTKASTATGATDNPIVFKFRHLLSKVAIYAGVEQNTATGNPTAWDDANTTITIDKIEFTGLADAYNYSCTIPMSGVTDKTACWSASSTTQDIVLTYSNGDFEISSAVINTANYSTAGFKDLLAKENNTGAFLFLAPQTFTDGNEQAIITYTVKTTASNSSNSSTITNTIATDLYDILSSANNAFTTGKAYTLKFLLGMNSVKITSTVDEWNTPTEHQIDVPSNATIQANTLDLAQEAVETGGGSNPTINTLTVIVTEDAVNTATENNVETVDNKNYLRFTLKNSSPENVNFELPSLPTSIQGLGDIAGWLVNHETNYSTDNVTVSAPAGTTVIIDTPDSHVELNGETYTKITASTGDNTLVIPAGTTVNSLVFEKGGLEIHGKVTEAQVSTSGEDKVYVRDCEGLSETVYGALEPYIDLENGYKGEQESGKSTYRIYKEIVAQVGDNYYYSLENAATAAAALSPTAGSKATIKLLADIKFSYARDAGKIISLENVTLDLNGKTISSKNYAVAYNGNNLTIKNGNFVVYDGPSPEAPGSYSLFVGFGDSKTTNVVIEDVTCTGGINFSNTVASIKGATVDAKRFYAVYSNKDTEVTIESGVYKHCTENYGYIVRKDDKGTLNLKGGIYSMQPVADYVAYGYTATDNGNNTWTVEPAFVYDETDSKYHIYNLAGLKMFRDAVNGGNTYVGKTIVLDASIDLASVDNWEPIGLVGKPFNGTFDGNSKTISNLTVTRDSYAGLFGYCINAGHIYNLTVSNANISSHHYAGAVLASGYVEILNCHVSNSTITCSAEETSSGVWDNGDKVGALLGFIGEGHSKIDGCSAINCIVKGYRDVGGLIGYKYSDNIVTNNTVTGTEGTFTVTVDNTHNYRSFTANADYWANAIVGHINGELDSSNTSTNVTISYPYND